MVDLQFCIIEFQSILNWKIKFVFIFLMKEIYSELSIVFARLSKNITLRGKILLFNFVLNIFGIKIFFFNFYIYRYPNFEIYYSSEKKINKIKLKNY